MGVSCTAVRGDRIATLLHDWVDWPTVGALIDSSSPQRLSDNYLGLVKSLTGHTLAMADEPSLGTCPFCAFTDPDTYALLLHVETLHSEGDSPFVVRPDAEDPEPQPPDPRQHPANRANYSIEALPELLFTGKDADADVFNDASYYEQGGEDEEYVACPEPDCGEAILLTELDSHIDMHSAEKTTADGNAVEEYGRESPRRRKKRVKRRYREPSELEFKVDDGVSKASSRHGARRHDDDDDDYDDEPPREPVARSWRSLFTGYNRTRGQAGTSKSSGPTHPGSGPRRLGVRPLDSPSSSLSTQSSLCLRNPN